MVGGLPRAVRCAVFSIVCFTSISAPLARVDAADNVRIAVAKADAAAPIFIAQEKGYFAKDGVRADIVFTDQPQIMPQAVLSGDLDFALAGMVAAFFNLAGDGSLRIIAGNLEEAPGFKGQAVVVSNQADAAGLKSFHDLAGHSVAIFAAGTPQQYDLSKLAAKYGFDYGSLRMMTLGTMPNMVSAVIGNSADAAVAPAPFIRQPLEAGKLHNLGWIGDEFGVAVTALITSGKTADNKSDLVNRVLRAYRTASRDYHDAFTGPDEKPKEGPTAPEIYSILSKYLNEPVETIKSGIGHIDGEARLNVADIQTQIAWYKSQGMVKPEVDAAKIIDARYAVPSPGKP